MNFFRQACVAAMMLAGAATTSARGEDLGTLGPIYPVREESALDTILRRLKALEASGELKRIERAAIARSIDGIKNPAPVEGIAAVTERAQRLIDPTVTYPAAIKDTDGRIVVPAGAKVNPLLVTRLTKRLVFFDGRDAAQAEAVRQLVAKNGAKVKPILVAGSWYDTSKAWRTQVFYDQHGRLTERFGIRGVPTVIRQQGAMLLLEEVPAGELK